MTVAAGFFPLALWLCGDGAVAVAVSVALLVACSTASLVALVLPWVLARLGFDPAFGSGPVATVVQGHRRRRECSQSREETQAAFAWLRHLRRFG